LTDLSKFDGGPVQARKAAPFSASLNSLSFLTPHLELNNLYILFSQEVFQLKTHSVWPRTIALSSSTSPAESSNEFFLGVKYVALIVE
jgi:hypothetical protein